MQFRLRKVGRTLVARAIPLIQCTQTTLYDAQPIKFSSKTVNVHWFATRLTTDANDYITCLILIPSFYVRNRIILVLQAPSRPRPPTIPSIKSWTSTWHFIHVSCYMQFCSCNGGIWKILLSEAGLWARTGHVWFSTVQRDESVYYNWDRERALFLHSPREVRSEHPEFRQQVHLEKIIVFYCHYNILGNKKHRATSVHLCVCGGGGGWG